MNASEIERYATLSRDIASYVDLEAFLSDVTPRIGFAYYMLIHYVPDPLAANVVTMTNLPEGLRQATLEARMLKISPIPSLCRTRVAGFSWAEALEAIGHTPEMEEIAGAYAGFDVGPSYFVPANLVDDLSGLFSFSVRLGEPLPTRMLPHAQYFSALAYDAARRVAKSMSFPSPAPADLTMRQLDCITLVARGKSDWEIGQLLEISKETVHKHIQAAMKRYDVTTRTQLVVRALYRSQISFDDVLK